MADRLGYTWYPKDFISDPDVMMMSPSERGIYRDLIDLAFMSDNKIKHSIEKLSKYCNATIKEVQDVLDIKGEKSGDFWTIPSCQKRIDKANVNRQNGKNGGRPKKPKQNPNENPNKTQTERQREREKESEQKLKDKKSAKADELDFDFNKYLDNINKLFGKKLRVVNKKAKQSINARLKEGYQKIDIWNAMQNVANDQWHKDKNYQHCTPQYFAQVKTLDMYSHKPKEQKNQIGGHTEYVLHD